MAELLSARWARAAALPALIELFPTLDEDSDPEGRIRFQIGDALEKIATDTVADELIAIARDTRHGSSRVLVVLALGNLRKSRDTVVPVLMDLRDDSDVQFGAMEALGRLKVTEARPWIEAFTQDKDPWVRQKARQALEKIPED